MIFFFHLAKVGYYQLVRPHLWRNIMQSASFQAKPGTYSAFKPLFFQEDSHNVIAEWIRSFNGENIIIHQAEAALQHEFAYFREEPILHGSEIDWQKDYASGKVYDSTKPAYLLDFMTSENGSDVKYPWDLSRMQWLSWLGMAHLLNPQDDRFVQGFKADIRSWVRQNPLGMGINWAMPMEVAIRATNWILAHSYFHGSSSLQDVFWQEFTEALWQHGRFLSYNLEYVRHNANHFLSNAMGLVVLGAFFIRTRIGKSWFRRGKAFLEKEMLRQFTEDGVNFEKSTSYHRFTVEMLTIAAVAAENIGNPFSSKFYERLTAANEYLFAVTRSDGSAPMIGDTDNGQVFRFWAKENHNNYLQIQLFSYYHVKKIFSPTQDKRNEVVSTLTNSLYSIHFQQLATNISSKINANFGESTLLSSPLDKHFIQGGYIVHKSEDTHLVIDVGDYGMNGWGGHGHNDCLSFDLWLYGQSIFTDSGTGCYTSNPLFRNYLRSTKAHNTLMIAGKEQTEWLKSSLWRIKKDELEPNVVEYESRKQGTEQILRIVAEHSGYKQRFGVLHRRTLKTSIHQHRGTFSVIDELLPSEAAMIGISGRVYFHIPQELTVIQRSNNQINIETERLRVTITSNSSFLLERSLFSRFYGDFSEVWECSTDCSLEKASRVEIAWECF